MKQIILAGLLIGLGCFAMPGWGQWKPHTVSLLNGKAGAIQLRGQVNFVTESPTQAVDIPFIVYMPEKDRLLMLISVAYPLYGQVLTSDDHGATWSQPKFVHLDTAGKPDVALSTSLTYLGGGKVVLSAGRTGKKWYITNEMWFSTDYGDTWGNPTSAPKVAGDLEMNLWDPFWVDKDAQTGKIDRLIAGGYTFDAERVNGTAMAGYENGGTRISTDEGHTWGDFLRVPEWAGVSEVAFVRAANGNLIAACRTDWPDRFRKMNFDNYEGLAVSISKDNGKTWSKLNRLYAWGRHHPCMVLLANGDIVMTYVVRMGYPRTVEGFPQFGVEAILSHDNGETWDLDHRYLLARWRGLTKGPDFWYASPQSTSTLPMPDGSLLTAFSTGYRALDPSREVHPAPRDAEVVSWRLSQALLQPARTFTDAPWDSDLRNEFNPDPDRHRVGSQCPAASGKRIISIPADAARASTSPSDGRPEYILPDPYCQPILTLETLPAWVEIRWPREHRIDEIHILPGAPQWVERASTECVPLDYRLQYEKAGKWLDLVPPIIKAQRYREIYKNKKSYITEDHEFEYVHKFSAVPVKAIRVYITRSSDTGIHPGAASKVAVPEDKRETALRSIEVFEAK